MYWFIAVLIFLFSCQKADVDCPEPCPENLRPVSEKLSRHCKGYYEYLPEGYHPDSANYLYPVLFFLHGAGEAGNGGAQLNRLLEHGPLKLIKEGTFPDSFVVNGKEFRFIIIAPQFTSGGVFHSEVDQIIDYAVNRYPADPARLYLTGLSSGGAICWHYAGLKGSTAGRLAAMAPVAANIDEEDNERRVTTGETETIAGAKLPIWSTHNDGDPLCDLSWVLRVHDLLKNMNPPPRLTIFDADVHGGWDQTYDPEFREDGMNIYEWMLSYNR